MIIILLGPPGAGKGSQAKKLQDRYHIEHLSSGDLLRWHRHENTKIGKEASTLMDQGKLVPDQLINDVMILAMKQKVDPAGFLLDGYPRTTHQARMLDQALDQQHKKMDLVLNLDVKDDALLARLTGRRTCPKCNRVYHVEFNPPEKPNLCNHDQEKLIQRTDDTADVIKQRIETYHKLTTPLIDYYQEKGILSHVDGNGEFDSITKTLYNLADHLLQKV